MKARVSQEYDHIPDNDGADLSDEEAAYTDSASHGTQRLGFGWSCIIIALAISALLNILCILKLNGTRGSNSSSYHSPYAHLIPDVIDRKIYPEHQYVDDNDLNATTIAWEALSGDPGVVALNSKYVAAMDLPIDLRYPWDTSKGVYLLQGFHNLHCIRTIYRAIIDYHLQRPPRIALVHVLHCLDELRQDVICHADDTPRYASTQDPPGTGRGQIKKCRDWKALEQWARKHTACFRHEDEVADRMVNRFKFCPDGSQPWLGKEDMPKQV